LPAPEIVAAAVAGDLAAARSIPGPKRAQLMADLRKTMEVPTPRRQGQTVEGR
jgi:hypothetical protein